MHRLGRGEFLRLSALAIGASFLPGEPHLKTEDTTRSSEAAEAQFSIGETTFAFEDSWTFPEREIIGDVIGDAYWKAAEVYGTEPTDSGGDTGVYTIIRQRQLPGGLFGQSETIPGTNRHDITLQSGLNIDQQRYLLTHELGHVFWGATTIGQWDRPPYRPLNEGHADAFAGQLGYTGESFSVMKQLYGIGRFDPSLANNPKIAFYGSSLPGLRSSRNILAAQACTELLREDPNFIRNLKQNYIELIQRGDPYKNVTIDAIRSLAADSFAGNWEDFQIGHHIMGDAIPGDHVLIVPVSSANLGEEVLAVLVFNRDPSGFNETPIPDVTVQTKYTVDGVSRPTVQRTTNDAGIVTLIRSSDLIDDQGAEVRVEAITEKGSDEVTFTA